MVLEVLLFTFLAIVVGLGLIFFGYAAFRILLPVVGFLGGFWLGMDAGTHVLANFPFLGVSIGLILGVILGLVFAALAYWVYALAVIIFGLSLGYALGSGLMLLLGFNYGFLTFMVGIIVAIMMGIAFLSVRMPQVYIMVLTSFAGASALIAGVLALFGQIPPSQLGLAAIDSYIGESWFWLTIWIVIGVVGFFIQNQMVKTAESYIPEMYSYDTTVKEYEKKAKKG